MSFLNGNSFLDRQTAAANARKAQAERFLEKTKYDPADPVVIEREAKRRAINEAREIRTAERMKFRLAAEAAEAKRRAQQEATDELARQEALKAEALAREKEHTEKLAALAAAEYEAKLERDARYAARKERKKKNKSERVRYG
jgi:Family of unknown function (DUF6481)